MSLRKIEQVREGKLFRIWDILVYALIIATAVALIIAFTLTRDNTALSGVTISLKGRDVFTYNFDEGEYVIASPANVIIAEEDESRLLVHVYDDGGFNDVEIDVEKRSARVTDADCSVRKDCVSTPPVTVNGSVPIACTPHGLIVRPMVFEDSGVIIT